MPESEHKPTLRCRLFGHYWGARIDGQWHTPNFGATHSAMATLAQCKRCGVRWRDAR